jgi:hypothetical protein
MKLLEMNSLSGVFDQFVDRFGPPVKHERQPTSLGVCVLASWTLADGTCVHLDEGDSSISGLGAYRTAYLRIVQPSSSEQPTMHERTDAI